MSLVGNTSSSLPYYMLPVATRAAAPVATVEDLTKLPKADQIAFVEANGTGSPQALLLPTADGMGESLASLTAHQNDVDVTPVPAEALSFLAQTPTGSTADTPSTTVFGGWAPDLRAFYFDQKASGSPPALFLPNGAGQALLTAAKDGTLQVSAAPDQFWANLFGAAYNGTTPQDPASNSLFGSLSGDLQSYYFAQKATGSPPTLLLSAPPNQALALLSSDGTVRVAPASDQFLADLAGKAFNGTAPQTPPALADFTGWDPSLQALYLGQNGEGAPKSALLPGVGTNGAAAYTLASLGPNGAVALTPAPADFAAELLAAPNGSTYDSATLEQFKAWPAAFEAYYLAHKGHGTLTFASSTVPGVDGVRQAALSGDGSVAYSTRRLLTDYWGTATSAPSAATILGQTQPLTADSFQLWPLASQISYLQANGTGSPPALLLPEAGGGHKLISVAPGSDIVQFTEVSDQVLADLYGTPVAGVDAAGNPVTTKPDPALALSTILKWPNALQTFFVAGAASPTPGTVSVLNDTPNSTFGQQVTLSVSGDGGSLTVTTAASTLQKDATLLSPSSTASMLSTAAFLDLPPDEQLAYYRAQLANARSAAPPSAVDQSLLASSSVLPLSDSAKFGTGPVVNYTIQGITFGVRIVGNFIPGATNSGLTYQDSWDPALKTAYVAANGLPATGYPKTLVLGQGQSRQVLYLPAAGATVESSAPPAGFDAGAKDLAPSTFLSWPYPAQLAWLQSQPSPVVLGTNPNDMEIARNADGAGFQVAMATDVTAFTRADAIQKLDFPLFSKVAPPELQAKLLATLADPGSAPPIITVTGNDDPDLKVPAVISAGTAATGGGYAIETVLPAGYLGLDPSAVTPAAFMAWSPAVRMSYVLHVLSKTGARLPGSAIAGATPAAAVPPFTIGTGVDVLAVTFSQGDGTLQVSLPQGLAGTVTSGVGASAATTALAGTLLPYDYLPGSAVGTSSAVNDAVSAALYPVFDGSGGAHNVQMSAQQQQDFAKEPAELPASTFAGWPSALQLQYLRVWQSPGTPLTIGSGTNSIDVLMQTTAVAGAIPKVYTVQNLQKADIGMMSYADQATLAKSRAFTAIANGLGLIPDDGSVAALGGNDVPDPNAGLTTATPATATTPALSAFGYVQTMFTTALNTIDDPTLVAPKPGLPDGNMPAADRKVFEDEVNLLRRQTFGSPLPTSQQNQSDGQAIFSPKDIQDKLTAIIQRFTRANAFSSVANSKTVTAGYFQIQNMSGYDPANRRTKYIYNPDGKTETTLEDDLGYYLLGDDRYRVPDRRNQDDDPQAYFRDRVASAFSKAGASLPSQYGVPFTLSGMNLALTTTNHNNGADSNGNYPPGDSMTIDTMTIERIDGAYDANWQEKKETDGNNSSSTKRVYNTFTLNGATYEIMSCSGSKLNAANNVPSTFSSLAASTYESNYHPYTENLSDFESQYNQNDDGKSILDYVNKLMNDPKTNYKDGFPHTITIDNSSGSPIAITDPHGSVGSSLNLSGFNVYNVTVRYVPAAASVDNNATIDSGYQTFMTQEKSVLDLANRADQLANSGKIGGTQQNLDVPNLVYLFMMYTNLTGEAVLRADTEEVNQTNAVLNEYAIMQKIINQTVAAIKPGDNGVAGSGSLRGSNPDGSFTAQDMGALAMFTHGNSTAGTGNAVGQNPPLSPIELLQNGFTRPYLDHGIDYSQSSTQWSSNGTALSDAVTQLNQASQLKMNDINSETKQKDREFDLANTALQKMSDIVNKIAASI